MSLILDALNRSRRDTDEVPDLAAEHYPQGGGEETGSLRRYLPWLALLAALSVIAGLLLERGGQAVKPLPAQDSAAPVAVTGAVPAEMTRPLAPPPQAAAEPVAGRPVPSPVLTPASDESAPAPAERSGQVRPEAESQPEAKPEPKPEAKPEPDAAVVDLYQQRAQKALEAGSAKPTVQERARQPATQPAPREPTGTATGNATPGSPEEQPVDIEKMVLKARDELKNTRLAEHPAPFLSELSQQTKDRIPTIYYERHDYSGEASRSVVVLNGKQLRAGGSAAAGVKVDEILPDSVVLNYRGTQFRLRALNSWINL